MRVKITTEEATNIIQRNVKGTMAISIDAVTVPTLLKTGNPFNDNILKHCTMSGLIGFDYENSVNNQDKREGGEGNRVAQPRKWGVLSDDRLFVLHKGKTYLQMKVQSSSLPVYTDLQGNEIPYESVKPFVPVKKASSTQEGIEKEVIVRDVNMENVKSMRFIGQDYVIISEQEKDTIIAAAIEADAVPA